MKWIRIFSALALMTIFTWSQSAPQSPAPPPAAPAHHDMHGGMMDMHKHMQSMEDQAAKMRATLEKMKANLSKITNPTMKQQAQLNVDLWEDMVQHMEGMSKMMKAHEGMGMMGGTGMKDHPPMPEEKPQTPEKK